MEKYIYNKQNDLHYELIGDYYYPCVATPQLRNIGVWGQRRLNYLRNHQKAIYTGMLLSGTLETHLEEIDRNASQIFDHTFHQLIIQANLSEATKEYDQLYWVTQMNNIRAQANEIVFSELIFT